MLVQYFRKGGNKRMYPYVTKKGRTVMKKGFGGGVKKGLFVAFMDDSKMKFGWSLCNTKAGDVFNEGRAMEIALGRANATAVKAIPDSMGEKAKKFLDRAQLYFKKAE